MLEADIRKIDFWGGNSLKSNIVNLDTDMDAVILISSKDSKLLDLIYHKIVDSLIDRIQVKNVYDDFSYALENINAFLIWWMHNGKKVLGLHAFIGIYHKKNFYFSTVWKASCYLHNSHQDVIEITDKEETPRDFSFISNWDIATSESLVVSTDQLLFTLSKDDIRDSFSFWDIERSGENIEKILLHEHSWKNIGLLLLQKDGEKEKQRFAFFDTCSHYFLRLMDSRFFKKILSYVYLFKKTLIHQGKKTRQILLGLWIFLSAWVLYFIISWFFSVSSNIASSDVAKEKLITAQNHIITASENTNDADIFSFNIETAETIISDLESENLFLNDLTKLKDEVNVLEKQFNGISPFETTAENQLFGFDAQKEIIEVITISGKTYVVHKDGITWPIIPNEEVPTASFDDMSPDDYFIDATVFASNIVLVTQVGKVVSFSTSWVFRFIDVVDQETWEKSPIIDAYADNLYLLSGEGNQVLRHKSAGENFAAGNEYLTDEDVLSMGNIVSLAIDGGIYILKQDGTIVKLFRSPKYRLESIVLNKLPKNYDFTELDSGKLPDIKTAINLKYVYMLLDNRILVFQPNSLRFQDVTSLNYLWQIEGRDVVIEGFSVENDGEITIASSTWVYKIEFDVIDEQLVLK